MFTDSVANLSRGEALDLAQSVGCTGVELATGGQSSAPHLDLQKLLSSTRARRELLAECRERGLRIAALNCSAWPLHPVVGRDHESLIRSTIELAGKLGVDTVVTMSGTPGDGGSASTFNWVWYPWPSEAVQLRERHWQDAVRFWQAVSSIAAECGVLQVALELHPLHLVYNVPTLLRLRGEVGAVIGANVDPSHLIWQGMEPQEVVLTLGSAVQFVHLKDTQMNPDRVAIAGVLDQSPFSEPDDRAWNFRAFGAAHDSEYWRRFRSALDAVQYGGSLSIENEDAALPGADGVTAAAAFARSVFDIPLRRAARSAEARR